MSTSSKPVATEVHYPDSDGQPMGETGIHVQATMELFATLKKIVFKDRPDVYVAADMFLYYEQGNPRAVKAPDVMVIKGVEGTVERRTFKLWIEKAAPCVIFEITSEETRRDDLIVKRELYARLGVAEYFLFDPLGEYLDPPLRGYALQGDHYEAMTLGADGGLESRELGLRIRAISDRVRLFDALTGQLIPNTEELYEQAMAAANLARDLSGERQRNVKLERKAEREKRKAESEKARVEALEAEVARLRALLGDRGPDPAS